MVERRLGRGLDFFLSGSREPAGDVVSELPITALEPNPFQPRTVFEESELEELAQSIRATGVLQPILVRQVGDKHQIIAGERRWRAAQKAGLDRIPALVRDIDDNMVAVLGLVENLQRTDLNPIEKARAFQRIQELTKTRQEEVARQVGLNRSTVANFLRLLDLAPEVQEHVSRGTLSMGHARALLGLAGHDEQVTVADEVIRKRLSVRDVEALVRDLSRATTPPDPEGARDDKPIRTGDKKGRPVWLDELEETLSEALRTPVSIRYGARRSKITIECKGRDEFERVFEQLKGSHPDSEQAE